MKLVFADTSALVALKNKSEVRHTEAISSFEELLRKKIKIITTNFVFAEVYALLRYRIGYQVAIDFGNFLRQSKLIQYLRATEEIENKAWGIALKYQDKEFSFTDCISFAVMEKLNIKEAFAFDEHFKQYGFTLFSEKG